MHTPTEIAAYILLTKLDIKIEPGSVKLYATRQTSTDLQVAFIVTRSTPGHSKPDHETIIASAGTDVTWIAPGHPRREGVTSKNGWVQHKS